MVRLGVIIASLCFSIISFAQEGTREEVAFISCPVYRDVDAGPKSGCWLATERGSGVQYDVSAAKSKPLLGQAILVEGVVSPGNEKFCGGVTLEPVRVSLLDEECPEHVITADEYPSRVFSLPKDVMKPTNVPRDLPPPPYVDKTFSVLFHFNSSFLNYQYSEVLLEKIALYIKAAKPASVKVVGYAATKPYVVDGVDLREEKKTAKARADMVVLALTRLGVRQEIIRQTHQYRPQTIDHYANGLDEETKRRVDIIVEL